jgi:hypothetical protein
MKYIYVTFAFIELQNKFHALKYLSVKSAEEYAMVKQSISYYYDVYYIPNITELVL